MTTKKNRMFTEIYKKNNWHCFKHKRNLISLAVTKASAQIKSEIFAFFFSNQKKSIKIRIRTKQKGKMQKCRKKRMKIIMFQKFKFFFSITICCTETTKNILSMDRTIYICGFMGICTNFTI
jgi:hypothetical protein